MVQRPDRDDVIAFIYIQDIEKEKQNQIAMKSSLTDGVESIAIIHLEDGQARMVRTNSDRIPKDVGETFVYDDNFVNRSHKAVIEEENEFGYQAARLTTVKKELAAKNIY